MAEFQTNKNDITKSRLVESGNRAEDFTLGEGEVLAKVERFSFTANNVTYGAVGEQIGYWEFFAPSLAADESADEWGIVPVWGFAEIVASNNPDIHIGERSYGYFPLANFLKMLPIRVSDTRFVDGAAHRSALPAVYNSYDRLGATWRNNPLRDILTNNWCSRRNYIVLLHYLSRPGYRKWIEKFSLD